MGSLINKNESAYIKGIAIILMCFHHLFVFQDRIPKSAHIIYLFDEFHVEYYIGFFGKICVSIFLCMSGYGFCVSKKQDIKYYCNKVLTLYKSVWLVFLIFIPIDYFIFHVPRIEMKANVFIMNLFGFSNSYNGEWWFLLPYILCILIMPLLLKLLTDSRHLIIPILVISIVLHNISADGFFGDFLYWQTAYVLGMVLGVYSDYLRNIRLSWFKKLLYSVVVLYLLDVGFSYWFGTIVFLSPVIALILKSLRGVTPKWIRIIIEELGNKCLFIWLTHSFYCYHIAADFIYSPQYSMLILVNLLVVSYTTAVILGKVMDHLNRLRLSNKILRVLL